MPDLQRHELAPLESRPASPPESEVGLRHVQPPETRIRVAIAQACEALGRHGAPGISLALTTREYGRLAVQHGEACLSPPRRVEPGTVFHLFSGTKLYTAAALMLLVERRLVSLDDVVTKHLPELGLSYPVTLRELASHSSGLHDTLRAFLAVHLAGDRCPSTGETLGRYRLSSAARPGRTAAYRNVNYAILGEVISRVSRTPYHQFMMDALIRPMQADLTFESGICAPELLATGYQPRMSLMRMVLPFVLPNAKELFALPVGRLLPLKPFDLDTSAIGGLMGSARAFLPFLEEMLSGTDGILSKSSKREILTLQSRGAVGITSRVGVGIGWKLGSVGATEFWNHEGGGPGFCTETRLYPREGIGLVILMNRTQSTRLSYAAHDACEHIRLSM